MGPKGPIRKVEKKLIANPCWVCFDTTIPSLQHNTTITMFSSSFKPVTEKATNTVTEEKETLKPMSEEASVRLRLEAEIQQQKDEIASLREKLEAERVVRIPPFKPVYTHYYGMDDCKGIGFDVPKCFKTNIWIVSSGQSRLMFSDRSQFERLNWVIDNFGNLYIVYKESGSNLSCNGPYRETLLFHNAPPSSTSGPWYCTRSLSFPDLGQHNYQFPLSDEMIDVLKSTPTADKFGRVEEDLRKRIIENNILEARFDVGLSDKLERLMGLHIIKFAAKQAWRLCD
jgi:hypothetical protein